MADNTRVKKLFAGLVIASSVLVASITREEGSETQVYQDVVGIATVCNGHTGPEVKLGDVWTKAQCDAILIKDIDKHGEGLLDCVNVPLNQHQYEALAGWTFNVGVHAACGSKLVTYYLNEKQNYTGACLELLKWNKAGGKVNKGIDARRHRDSKLCLTPMPVIKPAVPPLVVAA